MPGTRHPFSFPYGNRYLCEISQEVLAEGDKELLRRYGAEEHRGFFTHIDYRDFPDIFYTWRRVPFHGTDAPLYAQCLLMAPGRSVRQGVAPHEIEDVARLERDINNFPLNDFYERMNRLKGVRFRYDSRGKIDGLAIGRGGKIKIGKNLAERNDFIWCANLMLHELYHFVEFGMSDGCKLGDEWKLKLRKTKSGPTWLLGWEDEYEIPAVHEFAEFLSALTLIKHPEIYDRLVPHYLFLRDSAEEQRCMFRSDGVWDAEKTP